MRPRQEASALPRPLAAGDAARLARVFRLQAEGRAAEAAAVGPNASPTGG